MNFTYTENKFWPNNDFALAFFLPIFCGIPNMLMSLLRAVFNHIFLGISGTFIQIAFLGVGNMHAKFFFLRSKFK